ncbi:MBL fold metallo-hydrolase [Pacificibacter marinus]|uniref:Metallo-beta-lactamase superfamily protein n=1 Tax=Pacificibacter marinus TaxID=658057 RepID=A0A1Y5SCX9_9RHOB|nr:MBL fold metallo-hydrolase [Pacificibacter marinus]SEK51015.1 Glyoxylase, beta-lactamase superfamily II [Pacificibacter marinus]SLN37746.1 Metallo-beta-lactamase superfamily protein [Pacificibacter marinus]
MNRRTALKMTVAAGVAALVAPKVSLANEDGLSWTHFPAGENGFYRAPVLVSGPSEAVLIDGGFTLSDGQALADAIKSTGKTLTTIYVSQSDPDFYFSLRPIVEAFPEARVIAASETVAAINANVAKKVETWGPQLGENGPQSVEEVAMAEVDDSAILTVDGYVLDIVPATGLANRRYIWSEDLQAVFGGVMVFSGTHVWVADTQTKEERAAWIANLDAIIALAPKVVVPGHMTPDAPLGFDAVAFTKAYLLAVEDELAKATTSEDLNAAMRARYPELGMGMALDIGAKVLTGEMKWG